MPDLKTDHLCLTCLISQREKRETQKIIRRKPMGEKGKGGHPPKGFQDFQQKHRDSVSSRVTWQSKSSKYFNSILHKQRKAKNYKGR